MSLADVLMVAVAGAGAVFSLLATCAVVALAAAVVIDPAPLVLAAVLVAVVLF